MSVNMNLVNWDMSVNITFQVLWGVILLLIILIFIVVGRRSSR